MTGSPLLPTPALDRVVAKLGLQLPAVFAARERTAAKLAEMETTLAAGPTPPDTSVVVFGSLARGELTAASDMDWTLLVDGQAYAGHLDAMLDVERRLAGVGLKDPGREGTFGDMVFSHDLVHRIGGEDDTNRNTTLRLLLLLESRAIGDAEAYQRVVRQILRRYVEEDFGWMHSRNPRGVPRFLQNDVARYWRTLAVDFAYKRRDRQARGWALRTVELRLSRKLTYAAGLMACFSCSQRSPTSADAAGGALGLVGHLETVLRDPPLEIVAASLDPLLDNPVVSSAAGELLLAYDGFLALLGDASARKRLEELSPDAAASDPTYERAREIGRRFQGALTRLFVDPNGTYLYELTRVFGVF